MFKKIIFLTILAIVFTIGVFTVIAVNNRGNAPVAYWKFNEGYGSTAFDAAGSNDGTITNASWRNEEDCKSGKCLYFDGDGDYVQIVDNASLKPDNISISAWFRTNNKTVTQKIISKTEAADYALLLNNGIALGDCATGDLCLNINLETVGYKQANYSLSNINNNIWYHVVGTYDGQYLKLYLNGTLVDTYDAGAVYAINHATAPVCIGAEAGASSCLGNNFHGFIDDVRIYDYARTAAQIKADYLAGAGGRGATVIQNSKFKIQNSSEGLVGWWKMDESSWTVDCSTETVMDSSGAGNNGFACPNAGGLAPSAGKFGSAGLFDGTEDYIKIPDIDF